MQTKKKGRYTDEADREQARTEHRWPAIGAVLVALALYALLPSSFLPVVRYTVVGVCLALLIPLVIINPVRMNTERPWSRRLSIVLTVVLAAANTVALVQLITQLLQAESDQSGAMLLAAAQVWSTNVIEVARGSSAKSNWTASFVDYAYFSLSNAMAFSPPDAMPLSRRAKILVGVQALAAFTILVLVIARAVALLG